ncbi:hypothetical protein JCM8097_005499 [Rhodosporidiobolus ruineniae]
MTSSPSQRRSGLDNLFGAVLLNDKPLEVRGVQHEADGSVVAMLGTKEKPGAIKLRLFKEETPPTASTAAHAVHSASASNQPTASYTPSTQYHFPPASLGTANMTQAHVSHYYQLQQAYRCSSITGNEYKQLVQYTSALNKFYYAPVLGPLQPYGTQVGLGSSSLHPASNQLSPSSSSAAAQPAAAQPAASSSSPLTRLSDADLHSQLQALRQIRRLAELETELERCRAEEAAEGEPGVSFLGAAASGRGVKREADEVVKHDGEEEVVAAVKVEEDQREEEEVKPARKKTKKG